jgi:hypothetical protein
MENIGQMIVNNESPDAIRDAIITSLYSKAAERVEAAKPYVVSNVFGDDVDDEDEYEDEYEDEE